MDACQRILIFVKMGLTGKDLLGQLREILEIIGNGITDYVFQDRLAFCFKIPFMQYEKEKEMYIKINLKLYVAKC